MLICGLKLTHDGSVALIKDDQLIFNIEIEKLKNNPRYASIEDAQLILEILQEQGYHPSEIDEFAIDGWGGYDQSALALQPRLEIGERHNWLSIDNGGNPEKVAVAQYHERQLSDDILRGYEFTGLKIGERSYAYKSFLHVTGHVLGAYATSPFALAAEDAFIMVWDGGMYPRLYHYDAAENHMENYGPLFFLIGNIYSIFSQHFGPFKVSTSFAKDSLSVAGKVMAYIALGQVRPELFAIFEEVYTEHYNAPMGFANVFANEVKKRIALLESPYTDEDILCSFHEYMGEMLVEKLVKKVKRTGKTSVNLCLVGGCALNIKWNSLLREKSGFQRVFVPPFPNDSGSAIGAACAARYAHTGKAFINWSVYSGPVIQTGLVMNGWETRTCSLEGLADILHHSGEPVVFLHGKAELGPRALGNRSILASAQSPVMKDILNFVKKRESYRPVSPICLEEFAEEIFTPGCKDTYMLFDHRVKPEWLPRIPAICHLDGTARLQTVTDLENPTVAQLLRAYYQISGIPLLCNTSANLNGSGFFPDVSSALKWGQVNYVWSQNMLFERKEKIQFTSLSGLSQAATIA